MIAFIDASVCLALAALCDGLSRASASPTSTPTRKAAALARSPARSSRPTLTFARHSRTRSSSGETPSEMESNGCTGSAASALRRIPLDWTDAVLILTGAAVQRRSGTTDPPSPLPRLGAGCPFKDGRGREAWPRESRADRGYFVHWSSGRCLAGCRPGCRAFDVVAPQHL